MATDRICETFVLVAERFGREHETPLPKKLLSIGDPDNGWGARLNPTSAAIDGIDPFTAHVSWNGFPAGVIDPSGGVIAAGELANEEAFRAWLEGAGDER